MRPKLILCSIAALMFIETDAYAYLDPGTGSIILQALIAGVAGSLFVVKAYWYKLRNFLGIGRQNSETEDEMHGEQ
ncbi:MAG: hypothetical protein U1E67_10185 [Hyphomicrobiales bacterium]